MLYSQKTTDAVFGISHFMEGSVVALSSHESRQVSGLDTPGVFLISGKVCRSHATIVFLIAMNPDGSNAEPK